MCVFSLVLEKHFFVIEYKRIAQFFNKNLNVQQIVHSHGKRYFEKVQISKKVEDTEETNLKKAKVTQYTFSFTQPKQFLFFLYDHHLELETHYCNHC